MQARQPPMAIFTWLHVESLCLPEALLPQPNCKVLRGPFHHAGAFCSCICGVGSMKHQSYLHFLILFLVKTVLLGM
ncbi:hypothetical protein F4680DRAFT_408610 [Xylaria scruposa]|nr:hypothetical protein F4680DRAFT_408610 [Xylaria scruposa]